MSAVTDENLILIKEIKQRPELWNYYNTNYHNREITDKIWLDLSKKYSVPVEHLKTKWISLRSRFRKSYLQQMVNHKSNPGRKVVQSWKYFAPLLFLRNYMKKYKPKQSSDPQTESEDEIVDEVMKEFDTMEADYEDSDINKQNSTQPSMNFYDVVNYELCDPSANSVMNNLLESFQKDIVSLENEKVATIDESMTDEDVLFLHSILPFLKSLSLTKKLMLRTKIQTLVCDFISNLDKTYYDSVAAFNIDKRSQDIQVEENIPDIEIEVTNSPAIVQDIAPVLDSDLACQNNLENNHQPTVSNETNQNISFDEDTIDLSEGISLKRLKDDTCIWLLNVDD